MWILGCNDLIPFQNVGMHQCMMLTLSLIRFTKCAICIIKSFLIFMFIKWNLSIWASFHCYHFMIIVFDMWMEWYGSNLLGSTFLVMHQFSTMSSFVLFFKYIKHGIGTICPHSKSSTNATNVLILLRKTRFHKFCCIDQTLAKPMWICF